MTLRYLTSGSFFGISTSSHIDQKTGSADWVHYSEKNPITLIDYSYMRGYDTRNYSKLRKEGKIIPYTDWSQLFCKGEVTEGEFFLESTTYGFQQKNHGLTPPPWVNTSGWLYPRSFNENVLESDFGISLEDHGRDQVQRAAAKIYSSGWDALTWGAELHKVARMFKTFLKRLFGYSPKQLHDMWLEGRYGWRILMYDIRDIDEVLTNIHVERNRYKQSVGLSGSETKVSLDELSWDSGKSRLWLSYTDTVAWSIRGSVVADIRAPIKVTVNPITTAWELITFSFVIDWIIDVGQWLEAMSFLLVQNDYSAARGLQATFRRDTQCTAVSADAKYSTFDVTFNAWCESKYTRRLPTSVSKIPSLGLDLDVLKVIDILALLEKIRLRS